MKQKVKSSRNIEEPSYRKFKKPNKKFLLRVHEQASKMAELMGEIHGVQYLKDALKDCPQVIDSEVVVFSKRKR